MQNRPTPPAQPEVTIAETVRAVLADLTELAAGLPGDATANLRVASRLSEELAEVSARLLALPLRPPAFPGYAHQALAAFRSAVAAGDDIGEVIAIALARLAAELGGSALVLENRPGSWQAGLAAEMLADMVGKDDEHLATYRMDW